MNYTKRFEIWNNKLCLNYKIRWYASPNKYDGNRYWEHEENWYIVAGFEKSLFRAERLMYDLHKYNYVTILGLTIGYGYSYQDERMI